MDLEALLPKASFETLQGVWEAIEQGDIVAEEYAAVAQTEPMVFDRGVKLLLQNVSVQASYDLEPAYLSFQHPASLCDPGDVLDPG